MSNTFTIKASPGTDVWRKPPTTDVFNAPSTSPQGTKSTSPLSALISARVSFLLPQGSLKQYDQAGLLLSLTPHASSSSGQQPTPPKWIKAGVENYNGVPKAAVVACDAWADWSLAPVGGARGDWVTIAVENGRDELGRSLWVYQAVGGDKVPLREVCWPFGHGSGEEWELKVEAYACRPNKDGAEALEVEFKDFEVKWA